MEFPRYVHNGILAFLIILIILTLCYYFRVSRREQLLQRGLPYVFLGATNVALLILCAVVGDYDHPDNLAVELLLRFCLVFENVAKVPIPLPPPPD